MTAPSGHLASKLVVIRIDVKTIFIVVTVDATHWPVDFFHLHAGIANYFYHGGQRLQNFGLQPTKWIILSGRTKGEGWSTAN